jgi:hypothetical protein
MALVKTKDMYEKLDGNECEAIVRDAKLAAVALAKFWDTLNGLERKYGVDFNETDKAIGILAADCSTPPTATDLRTLCAEDVLEHLKITKDGAL